MSEEDPTAIDPNEQEPDEDSLPDKPPIDIPEQDVLPPTDEEEEDVHDDEYLPEAEAASDPTVDDAERLEDPHDPSTLDIAED